MNRLQLELKHYCTNNEIQYLKYNKLISNHIKNKNRNTLKLNNKLYLKYSIDNHKYFLTRFSTEFTIKPQQDIAAVHGTDIEQLMIQTLEQEIKNE